jgi:hypothetical protein
MADSQPPITNAVLDNVLRAKRQARHAHPSPAALTLHREIATRLIDDLGDYQRDFHSVGLLGDHGGLLRAALAARMPHSRIETIAIAPTADGQSEILTLHLMPLDLIISNLELQACNDIKGVLWQARRALAPDGLFLASVLGAESFFEMRQCLFDAEIALRGGAGPRAIPLPEFAALSSLFPALPFALPVVHQERLQLAIPSLDWLLSQIRALGYANFARQRSTLPLRLDILALAQKLYSERFKNADGALIASIQIIYLNAWAPAASQQQALRPGSAKSRLADALDGQEMGTGDSARP